MRTNVLGWTALLVLWVTSSAWGQTTEPASPLATPSLLASDIHGTVWEDELTDGGRSSASPLTPSKISEASPAERLQAAGDKTPFPSVDVTGLFQLDTGYYRQSVNNRATLGDIDDGLGFRRMRLAAKGSVAENASYIVELDLAQSQARVVDTWLQTKMAHGGTLRIGRFRQPFGMAELTSVRELPFLERPLLFTLGPFRQTGIMLSGTTPDQGRTWAVSGFRYPSDNFGNVFSDTDGYGVASRLTTVPWACGPNQLWHLGVGYSYATPGHSVVQFVSSNELFLGNNPNQGPAGLSVLPIVGVPPFVNTGPLAADGVQFVNLESALAWGRLAFQSEWRLTQVDQSGTGAVTFPGAYVQLRYMLTGETIPYSRSAGTFGRVIPMCDAGSQEGWGAWELLFRASHLDLIDTGINGRRLTDLTLGCNWYWNQYTKLQFNWIHSSLDDVGLGNSAADAFAIRAQLDF